MLGPRVLSRHPPPPAGFDQISLPLVYRAGPFCRVHDREFGPLHFRAPTRKDGRFDVDAGVMYAALDHEGAFLEVVLRDWGLGQNVRLLSRRFLQSRRLSLVQFERPLRLVDISEDGAAMLGVDARISTGADYPMAQTWAEAIWSHPERPDGIFYTSRHNARLHSVAIFRRRCAGEDTASHEPAEGGRGTEPEDCAQAIPLGSFLEPPYVELLDKYEIGLT